MYVFDVSLDVCMNNIPFLAGNDHERHSLRYILSYIITIMLAHSTDIVTYS